MSSTPKRVALNDKTAANYPAPQKAAVFVSDAATKGLQLKVFATGERWWWWQFRWDDSVGRLMIGPFGTSGQPNEFNYARARLQAMEWHYKKKVEKRDPRTFQHDPARDVTLTDVIDAYASYVAKESTRQNVRAVTKPLLEEHGSTRMADFDARCFLAYLKKAHRRSDDGREVTISPGTARSVVARVRAAVNHAMKSSIGLLPPDYRNPAAKLTHETPWLRHKRTYGHAISLEDEQWRLILNGIARLKEAHARGVKPAPVQIDGRDRSVPPSHPIGVLLIEFLLVTGMRSDEAASLRLSEVRGDHLLLDDHKSSERTGQPKRIPLNAHAKGVLKEAAEWRTKLRDKSGFVFPSVAKQRNRAAHVSSPGHYAQVVGVAAGFPFKLKPHSLRGAFINFAIDNGVDIAVVAEIVGHANVAITQRWYMRNRASKIEDAMASVDEALRRVRSAEA